MYKESTKEIFDTIRSSIIYEDKGLLVLNKKSGYSVCGDCDAKGIISIVRRIREQKWPPHLIHRLDQGTSGCLLIAKSRPVLLSWQKLFFERKIKKEYLFLTEGVWKLGEIMVNNKLKVTNYSGKKHTKISPLGKDAITIFSLKKQFKNYALISAEPITGRTHQIRVHARYIGYPVVGDTQYGNKKSVSISSNKKISRMFLHCSRIDRFFSRPDSEFSAFPKEK